MGYIQVRLIFEGGFYLQVFLANCGLYFRAASIKGQFEFKCGLYSRK